MAQKKIQQDQTDGLVKGPASSTDNAIARFDSTTGKIIQSSTETRLLDSGRLELGPVEGVPMYPSARLSLSDPNGSLSDFSFSVNGPGFPTLNLGKSNGTPSVPTNLNPNDYDTLTELAVHAYLGSAWQQAGKLGFYLTPYYTTGITDYLTSFYINLSGGGTAGFAFTHNDESGNGALANRIVLNTTSTGTAPYIGSFGVDGFNIKTAGGSAVVQANGVPVATTTGTQTLTNKTLTTPVINTNASVTGAAATNRSVVFETGTSDRIEIGASNAAEAGSNAGSDLFVNTYTDAGAYLATPLVLTRSTGSLTLNNGLNVAGGNLTVASVAVPTISSTSTLTNKRITPRVSVQSTWGFGTEVANADTQDMKVHTGINGAITIGAPTGTPVDGQKFMFRLKDNGTARAITWNAIFRAIGVTLPTTTVISKTLYVGCVYNSTDTKWDVIAVSQEA